MTNSQSNGTSQVYCHVLTYLLIESLDVIRASGRSDTVYHGVREGNVLLHPSSEFSILSLNEGHESFAGCVSIMLEIVAREDSDRTIACSLTATNTFCYITEGCLRLLRILEVVSHLRIVEHKLACLAVDVISALCDGEGDDLDVLAGNLGKDLLLLLDTPIEFYERTYSYIR